LWGEPAVAAIAAVKPFGRVVNLGQSAGAEATLTSAAVRSTPIDLLGYTNYTVGEERKREAYAEMAEHAAAGRLVVEIERLGLDDVPAAWERQGSSPHAKLVIVP
jgi:NADPH2:quinone reductase